MISLTDSAVSAVKKEVIRSGRANAGFRIGLMSGGCAGYRYLLGVETKQRQDDEVMEMEGIRIFVDRTAMPLLDGLKVDFVKDVARSRFAFDNPNASKTCNCGKSFC